MSTALESPATDARPTPLPGVDDHKPIMVTSDLAPRKLSVRHGLSKGTLGETWMRTLLLRWLETRAVYTQSARVGDVPLLSLVGRRPQHPQVLLGCTLILSPRQFLPY